MGRSGGATDGGVRRAHALLLMVLVGWSGLNPAVAYAQGRQRASGATAGPGTAEAAVPQAPGRTVSGRVINMLTGAPVPRALVRINGSGMLTDHEGRFEFNDVVGVVGDGTTVQVMKPGFTAGGDQMGGGMGFVHLGDAAGPVELHLTPEALITGNVVSKAGEPLANVSIQLRRAIYYQPIGGLQIMGQTVTDSHGEFRFPVPAGDYTLETQFDAGAQGSGEAALPVRYPGGVSDGGSQTMHLKSGEQRVVELRPETTRSYVVTASAPADTGIGQITASPAKGVPIRVFAQPVGHGEVRFRLPAGTYTLRVMSPQMETPEEAMTRVTVTDHDVTGVVLNFLPVPAIPIEMEFEPATKSDNDATRPQQPTLMLQPVDAGPYEVQTIQVDRGRQRPGEPPARPMIHAPAGTYKVSEMGFGGNWYVKSISFGGTDLLTQNLTVAAGSDGVPIRVRYSDQVADLSVMVSMDGRPLGSFVYLIPTSPSPVPVMIRRAGPDGKFSIPNLPPGNYDVLATEFTPNLPLSDVRVRGRFAKYVKSLSINAGEKATLDLVAIPEAELQP